MVYLLTVSGSETEEKQLKEVYKELAAKLSDDFWNMDFCRSISECREYIKNEPLLDLICVDISLKESIDFLGILRKRYLSSGLVLVADVNTPPTAYLRPGIRPDGILIRPFVRNGIIRTLEDCFVSYLTAYDEERDDSFIVETRDGKTVIPYNKIYYFEAREKKVFLRTLHEEFGFYATIEELMLCLPNYFLRTHRSFIANKCMVENLKNNMLNLHQGFAVPVSRSYKAELVAGLRKNTGGQHIGTE